MNKTLNILLVLFALGLIICNIIFIDFEAPLQGDSTIALIGIVAVLCALLLLSIFTASRKIQKRINEEDANIRKA